jgi:hypothetical protein
MTTLQNRPPWYMEINPLSCILRSMSRDLYGLAPVLPGIGARSPGNKENRENNLEIDFGIKNNCRNSFNS